MCEVLGDSHNTATGGQVWLAIINTINTGGSMHASPPVDHTTHTTTLFIFCGLTVLQCNDVPKKEGDIFSTLSTIY